MNLPTTPCFDRSSSVRSGVAGVASTAGSAAEPSTLSSASWEGVSGFVAEGRASSVTGAGAEIAEGSEFGVDAWAAWAKRAAARSALALAFTSLDNDFSVYALWSKTPSDDDFSSLR